MVNKILLLLLCTLSVSSTLGNESADKSKFLFIAPQALSLDKNESFHLLIFDNPDNESFKIRLILPKNDTELSSITIPYDPETVHYAVNFPMKSVDERYATLEVMYGANKSLSSDVQLYQEKTLMFIETDKPFYKPGELVRFRLLHLKRNLQSIKTPLSKVWIENPSNIKVAQWKNVEVKRGFAQLEMQLSKEPVNGIWRIKVQTSNSSDTVAKDFQIKEYVLPKFEVTLEPPSYILSKANKSYSWKVCAKYSFGAPVQGKAKVDFTFEEPTYWWSKQSENSTMKTETLNGELRKEDGCNVFVLSSEIIAKYEKNYLQGIRANATVEEEGTGEAQTTSHTSQFQTENIKFSFANSPKYYYPGLPYHGEFSVRYRDGTAASNIELEIRVKNGKNSIEAETISAFSDTSGQVLFTILTTNFSDEFFVLVKCQRNNADCNSVEHYTIIPWFSPSSSYIMISGQSEAACGETLDLEIFYTFPSSQLGEKLRLYYLVQTKGDIAKQGNVTIRKKAHNIDSDYWRNTFFKSHLSNEKIAVSIGKWNLKLPIEAVFSPEIKIVVFYNTKGSKTEIVASSKTVKVQSCLLNKVEAKFTERTAEPGQRVTLSVSTSSDSLCALSAVDRAVTFLEKKRELNIETVFEKIVVASAKPKQYSAEADYYVDKCANSSHDAFHGERKKRSMWRQPRKPFGNAKRAFMDGGILMLSNMENNIKPCEFGDFKENCDECPFDAYIPDAIMGRSLPIDDDVVMLTKHRHRIGKKGRTSSRAKQAAIETNNVNVELVEMRSDFPESWLWQLEEISGNSKKMELETPHTITDWVLNTVCVSQEEGLGIAPETSIRVMKPYFIDFTLPYSVKRGEILLLKVSLFNYLNDDIPIKIYFGDFTGGDLKSAATYTACVKRKDKLVHTFELSAKVLGLHNISVISKVDFDNSSCGPDILTEMSDGVTKSIKIKPEGFPVEITKSMFLCLEGEDETALMSWHLNVPENSVPDSARGDVSIIGDLMGPSLENLDSLVRLPTGCGEQNMVLFAPNIVVLKYLEATDSLSPTLRGKATDNLVKGYQRELTYRHDDGSYSAFGKSDTSGSMWLTAFVVKSFAQAKKYIYVDQQELKKSTDWILSHQMENGCFRQVGTMFSKEMKGGIDSSGSIVAFSSYIMIALLDSKIDINKKVLENGLYCLRKGQEAEDTYTQVLSAYALQLIRERISTVITTSAAQNSLEKVLQSATTTNQSEIFWQKSGTENHALNVEMTAYAILTLSLAGGEENLMLAFSAVKWISQQRNSQGGFVSTQDTVVALEALAKYAMSVPLKTVKMSVQATTDDNDVMDFKIDNENRQILQQREIPYVPTNLHWTARGKGCSLIQSSLRYNLQSATFVSDRTFTVERKVANLVPGSCSELHLAFNLTYNLQDGASNMAVLKVEMLSGYEPEHSSLDDLKSRLEIFKRWDHNDGVLDLYFDSIESSTVVNVDFIVVQKVVVDNVKPAQIKLYDYYEEESFDQEEYGIHGLICNQQQEGDQIPRQGAVADEPNSAHGNTLDDRFKDFKNVDFDLDFPEGEEGPVPVYVPAPEYK